MKRRYEKDFKKASDFRFYTHEHFRKRCQPMFITLFSETKTEVILEDLEVVQSVVFYLKTIEGEEILRHDVLFREIDLIRSIETLAIRTAKLIKEKYEKHFIV